jgi:hypothetical protein
MIWFVIKRTDVQVDFTRDQYKIEPKKNVDFWYIEKLDYFIQALIVSQRLLDNWPNNLEVFYYNAPEHIKLNLKIFKPYQSKSTKIDAIIDKEEE